MAKDRARDSKRVPKLGAQPSQSDVNRANLFGYISNEEAYHLSNPMHDERMTPKIYESETMRDVKKAHKNAGLTD